VAAAPAMSSKGGVYMRTALSASGARRDAAILGLMFACVVSFPFGFIFGAEDQDPGAVAGRVISIDSASGAGVAGIGLRLDGDRLEQPRRTVSQAEGRFAFTGLAPGAYTLSVESPGFDAQPVAVEVPPGSEVRRDVTLTAEFEDSITITATRTARAVEQVPAAVSVIGSDIIEKTPMTNIREAIVGTPGTLIESKSQGYDARLIIRGAGLKARYAIREVMVLLNGIPITDPDSLTRLDFVDTHLVDRIEVVRGPNSTLWGINSTGGAINVVSKSPFDGRGGGARLDVGNFGSRNVQLGYTGDLADTTFFNVNFSRRQSKNDWREWNEFDTTQFTLQPSWILGNGWVWENFISYTDADLQLPGRLIVNNRFGVDQWTPYMETGDVERTAEPWKHSSRNSEILFFGSKLVKRFGKIQFMPVLYLNSWKHFHPVTARINDADTLVGGIDLQADYDHGFGVLTGGVTARIDNQDSLAFTYDDVISTPSGRILSTLSDEPGDLMRKLERGTSLYGIYAQESMHFGERWLVDVGARFDRITFDVQGHEWIDYDWSSGSYVDGDGPIDTVETYTAFSPRVGVVFNASDAVHLYGNISSGAQTPTSDELTLNPNLNLTTVRNYEIGIKSRWRNLTFDTSVYYSPVFDEVVQVIQPFGETEYVNAGETEKKGIEVALTWFPASGVSLGGSYTYSDYTYKEFSEPAFGQNIDRSGNSLPYIPEHYYSLFAAFLHRSGFYLRATANTWGEYWMDNANSEKYKGYDLVTDLTAGYRVGRYEVALIVQNLFDQRYAVEAQKDLYGGLRYSPAAPRSILARFAVNF
jgi:iron complex outermembrane receptor protein